MGLESSANIVSVSENMPGYIDMCDVLSYRSDHLVRPFLGKKWKNILETTWTERESEFIQSL